MQKRNYLDALEEAAVFANTGNHRKYVIEKIRNPIWEITGIINIQVLSSGKDELIIARRLDRV